MLGWLAALIGLLAAGCGYDGPRPVAVRLGGAQIPVELVQSWLRDARSRSFVVTQVPPVYLSQHGFENLAEGDCDVACTDRKLTPRELEQFGQRAVHGYRVAFYGYALYVHPSNPLDAVFSRHVEMILQQRITDWHELAGEQIPELAGPIRVCGLAKGTRAGQQLSHMARIWFARPTWKTLESDEEIIAAVARDPLALGLAGIGHDNDRVRYLGLRMERTGRPAFPSLEEIESERYGLAKLIYVYFTMPESAAAEAVVTYLLSDEGRAAIEATDVWAIPPERADLAPVP